MVVGCVLTSLTSTMEAAVPFKEGYLFFPPQGVLGQLKKSWHKKYCQLFKPSNHGIERLEIFDSAEEVCKNTCIRIITLENCVKINPDAQKQQPNVFIIVTKTGDHHFASATEKEMIDWVAALQSVAFKDHCSRQTIEEDNDLYCSTSEDGMQTNGIFTVQLVASEASNRCHLEPGSYTLVVTSAAIQLRHCRDYRLLATWPYCYIRRYGYREGTFTFEAGRKCSTGEGDFHLKHSNRQEIFRCISSKMKSMRKMLSGDTPPSSGILCGDNQFQAALSMEARSRSPLPPSPTSATTQLSDLDFSAISHSSSKPFVALETQPLVIGNAPLLKPQSKPAKPPRKHMYTKNQNKSSQEDSTASVGSYKKLLDPDSASLDYDNVEVRSEAWRTQGVDVMTHTESGLCSSETDEDEEADYATCTQQLPKTSNAPNRPGGTKILLTQLSNKSDLSDNYDTLQHFGSSSRLNSNPGYKHIPSPISSNKPPPLPVSAAPTVDPYLPFNEYVEITEMQACRLADDSHLGYGMIRKKSVPSKADTQLNLGPSQPSHKVYNEMEYAIVEKPRKV